jgi:hypothetical protein
MERGAINTLRDIGVQILVLDEIHNILARSWREQRIVLNTLRFLSNELKLSLVCFGIMEARDAINGDVQLARRFCGRRSLHTRAIDSGPPTGHRPGSIAITE